MKEVRCVDQNTATLYFSMDSGAWLVNLVSSISGHLCWAAGGTVASCREPQAESGKPRSSQALPPTSGWLTLSPTGICFLPSETLALHNAQRNCNMKIFQKICRVLQQDGQLISQNNSYVTFLGHQSKLE